MNKVAFVIFLLCFGTAAAQTKYGWYTEASNKKATRRISFSVSNPLAISLKNEGIIIKRKAMGVTMYFKCLSLRIFRMSIWYLVAGAWGR